MLNVTHIVYNMHSVLFVRICACMQSNIKYVQNHEMDVSN